MGAKHPICMSKPKLSVLVLLCAALTACYWAPADASSNGELAVRISMQPDNTLQSAEVSALEAIPPELPEDGILVGYIIEERLLASGPEQAAEAFTALFTAAEEAAEGVSEPQTLAVSGELSNRVKGFVALAAAGSSGSYTFSGLPAERRYLVVAEHREANELPMLEDAPKHVGWDYVRVPGGATAVVDLSLSDDTEGFADHLEDAYGFPPSADLTGQLIIDLSETPAEEYWEPEEPLYFDLLDANAYGDGPAVDFTGINDPLGFQGWYEDDAVVVLNAAGEQQQKTGNRAALEPRADLGPLVYEIQGVVPNMAWRLLIIDRPGREPPPPESGTAVLSEPFFTDEEQTQAPPDGENGFYAFVTWPPLT